MHNFNYWLQDRDVKYFKEFYLLKGFVFNEQGEPKDVSEPKLDDDGRFWLVPRPGAMPGTDGNFDDRDLIRIKANSPNAGALVRQHQDRWKEFNAKKTAQKAKNAPQNTDPSFANTSPRKLLPIETFKALTSEQQIAQVRRNEYASKLGLNKDQKEQALKGEYDQTINDAIAAEAIQNNQETFQTLNGAKLSTFNYKRILVKNYGKHWFDWDDRYKKIWRASTQDIADIENGKYDIKSNSTEPESPPATTAEPTQEDVAEYKKIQNELKALNNRYKEIRDYLESNSDTIDDMQLDTYKKEARDILSKIAPLKQKLNVLNQKKPAAAAPPAVASTSNPAMPPAGASTPNPAMPPAGDPEEAKKISLDRQEKDLLSQYNKLTVEEDAQERSRTNPELLARIKKDLEDIATKIVAVKEERAAMKR